MEKAVPTNSNECAKVPSTAATSRESLHSLRVALFCWLASIYDLGTSKHSRMQAMEGLRGLAILLVFLCHYDLIILAQLPIGPVLERFGRVVRDVGGTGVDLFFVLSGILIYRAVLKPNMKYSSFLARRAQRIYPTFLAVLMVYVAINVLLMTRLHINPEYQRIPRGLVHSVAYLLANVAFLPGLFPIRPIMNVAWSLSYEWFFYLLLPVVVVTTGIVSWRPRNRIALFFLLAFLFVSLTLLLPDAFHASSNPIRRSHVTLIMFLAGMIVSDALQCEVRRPPRWIGISVSGISDSFRSRIRRYDSD
jgi:peptidoglycan/LPS O-acetylase OafA/YrhL